MKNKAEQSSQEQAKRPGFLRRHKGKLLLAAAGASIAIPLANGHGDEMLHEAEAVAPWVLPGMAVAETAWIGGAVLCVSSVGGKNLKAVARHPLKARSEFKSIVSEAASTKAFKIGLAVNTAGAVAEFALPFTAVVTHMPVESWGVATPAVADFIATVAFRSAIYNATRNQPDAGEISPAAHQPLEDTSPQLQPELLTD